ncbi:MAG TPA: ABC transporter substrate-binding protein [Gaiellaceae bacterium]|nr:ABC transporter substrate-binding protein [Gaiellaceae bacterium]HUJ56521.1 ABC transporter substrate-binding protein [Gaiellaceae bacterium]
MFRRTLAFPAIVSIALVAVSLSAAAPTRRQRADDYPQRIVSLSPTATEDLFAIGAGRQVVAVDQDSDYPKRAPRTQLSGLEPNVEAIATYQPDLVVISNGGPFVSQLEQLGIRVVAEPAAKTILGDYQQLKQLGRITGHLSQAKALTRSMARRLRAVVRSVPRSRRHLRIYDELDPTYYSATSHTFIGRILALFGFRNIADAADKEHTGYPQLSAEYILASNPQLIVLSDGQSPARVAKRPGWRTVAAVEDHRVVDVNEDIASRWGPRIVDFARAIAAIARRD